MREIDYVEIKAKVSLKQSVSKGLGRETLATH